jgi:hypothetical protein
LSALGICLALAATAGDPGATVFVPTSRFTLAWTHSIEKVRWEEDYEVRSAGPSEPAVLAATQARVRGSAAGMEPGPDAVLRDGWYHYRPEQGEHAELWLTRSPYTADYDLCIEGRCQPLSAWLPTDGWRTRLWPCRG